MFKKRVSTLMLACLTALGALPAMAAQDYPSRPVTLVVPYTPGGSSDVIARTLAEALRKDLGQTVIVENKPGAGTAIGSDYVARAQPDGYTVLFAGSGLSILPAISKTNYDPVKSFEPVSQILTLPFFLVVRSELPIKSLDELISYAKANPGKLNYGSAGSGTITHLQMELFSKLAGIEMMHIPYKGSAPGVTDLLSGRLQLMFEGLSTVGPHIKSGVLRPLAVAMPDVSGALPDVPTVQQSGLKNYDATAWAGVLAPAGTPKEVVNKLNQSIHRALQDPDLRQRVADLGGNVTPSTPQQIGERISEETKKWNALARELNLEQ